LLQNLKGFSGLLGFLGENSHLLPRSTELKKRNHAESRERGNTKTKQNPKSGFH
jgi:hypothetical protein